ncbi:SGNH/GDSL hydrolase family protein [Lacihabitans soyangensis]|uniref:SGNH/GDSL hydrolase family protein n=1 Tax=Lacihabitans soyangensis TaxID=869394 RepID=A0AAE3KT56_9BACT|nr:SGNH/GDSL hydrolase family protein [Lacihabitans soyangensis]MCP9764047.1 SGNH/GDSL hydrolase family protein [Lacihabitans soyangensis]
MSNGLSYLALGDSYTIGESVTEDQRWPVQLTKSLTSNGIAVSQPQIIAKTGWTTDELKAKIVSENITKKYDLVSLLIGVNNQYRGRSVEEFRKEYIDLLETAIQFSGNQPQHVFVVSIPDWGVTPFGINSPKKSISEQIDLFNAIKKEETEKRGILFIDITPISRQALNDPSLIAEDGLHPSGKMYQLWTEKIVPELLKKLKP